MSPSSRLLRNALREALGVAAVWLLALSWTVGYCWLFGYRHEADSWPVRAGLVAADAPAVGMVWGMPAWVVWGIVAPWGVCSVVTVVAGLWLMPDDDLGAEGDLPGGHP